MDIILYGEYNNQISKLIGEKNIIAQIADESEKVVGDNCHKLDLKAVNGMECDYILITGEDLEKKFLTLVEYGIKASKIRTIQDLTCERSEMIMNTTFYNELCMDSFKSSKRRVLMVSQDFADSGAPLVFLNMACSLQRMGYHVLVYCQCDGPMREGFLKNRIPVCIEDLTEKVNLANWLHREGFAFAIVNTLLQYKLVQRLGSAGLNTIWWLHECENYYYSVLEVEGKMPRMEHCVYPTFVGDRVKEDFCRYFGNELSGNELLYGVEDNADRIDNEEKDKITFAIIGAIQYRKGQDVYIDAVRKLTEEERTKCKFEIIGASSFKDNNIIKYVRNAENDISEINYLGGLAYNDMQRRYKSIDVIVCPSRIDPMPVAVTEGLMNNKICVISDNIGTAKYITDGINGFVCETGNADSLADKMRYIITHWDTIGEIGTNGRKVYEEYFAIDKFNSALEDLLKKIDKEREEMIIFTSICSNYTHKARVLAESVKKNIPGARFIVCLTERAVPDIVKCEYFDEIILAKDIWKDNFDHFIFKHGIVEASTAVKGRFLQYLMEAYDNDKFIYLDPDCYVYSDFVELRELLDRKPIVVCPHLLQPGNIDMELSATSHGIYNLGFLAVRKCEESQRFINWWTERLELFCYDDIPKGIFTDQKWVDLAPCFFDVEIFKHKGYDFSIWSLMDCGLEEYNGEYFVKGYPLRFIHFSGQGEMAEKCMRDWLPEGEHPFKVLYNRYNELHAWSDRDNVSRTVWTYNSYEDGSEISNEVRIAYRNNISWLPVSNPFALNDEILAGKMGLTLNEKKEKKQTKENIYTYMKIISSFYDLWNSGKKVIFYGAGVYGKEFYKFCNDRKLKVTAFMISGQPEQKDFCGIPIVSVVNNVYKNEEVIIVPTLKYVLHDEVRAILAENGYENIFSIDSKELYDKLRRFVNLA